MCLAPDSLSRYRVALIAIYRIHIALLDTKPPCWRQWIAATQCEDMLPGAYFAALLAVRRMKRNSGNWRGDRRVTSRWPRIQTQHYSQTLGRLRGVISTIACNRLSVSDLA